MALTTPSSQEAQSTFRTWSDPHRAASQTSAEKIRLSGTSSLSSLHQRTYREMFDSIKQLPHLFPEL